MASKWQNHKAVAAKKKPVENCSQGTPSLKIHEQ